VVAQHGSWNRTEPIGYQVLRVKFSRGQPVSAEPLLSGFLQKGSAWGRPVDVLEREDGSLLISDDTAGAVYLVTKKK
jgi:glucose/arabinose dehydrogenase